MTDTTCRCPDPLRAASADCPLHGHAAAIRSAQPPPAGRTIFDARCRTCGGGRIVTHARLATDGTPAARLVPCPDCAGATRRRLSANQGDQMTSTTEGPAVYRLVAANSDGFVLDLPETVAHMMAHDDGDEPCEDCPDSISIRTGTALPDGDMLPGVCRSSDVVVESGSLDWLGTADTLDVLRHAQAIAAALDAAAPAGPIITIVDARCGTCGGGRIVSHARRVADGTVAVGYAPCPDCT